MEKREVREIVNRDPEFILFKSIFLRLKERYSLSSTELLNNVEDNLNIILLNIFIHMLSPLETITKYLKENSQYSIKSISKIINRSEKTVWFAYNSSRKKHPFPLQFSDTKYFIDPSIFADRKFSIMEHIVFHLKTAYALAFRDIAKLINRDPRTVWTTYRRYLDKNKNERN